MTFSSWFQKFSSNSLQMRAVWKKVFKNLFSAQCEKFSFSEKCQKVLDFDNALWPNHSTHNKAKGIYGKMISISFIWHPRVWNMPTGWVTMAQGKSWPHVGRGKKWVIRPYPLACPWSVSWRPCNILFAFQGLKEAFKIFDRNKNGYIETVELKNVLNMMGQSLTDEEFEMFWR